MAKKAKKRGVKPGTKRGSYRKERGEPIFKIDWSKVSDYQPQTPSTPSPVLTLCGQLEDAVMLLETRISNVIAKINSLM